MTEQICEHPHSKAYTHAHTHNEINVFSDRKAILAAKYNSSQDDNNNGGRELSLFKSGSSSVVRKEREALMRMSDAQKWQFCRTLIRSQKMMYEEEYS